MTTDPPTGSAPQTVDGLRASLTALISESQALRKDVKTAEEARKRATGVSLGLLGLVAIFVALLLAVGWQNNQLVHKVNQTNAAMSDCTNPGGTCYTQGAQRYAQAIGDVIRAELFMAECARLYPGEVGPTYDAKLEKCVYGRLASTAGHAPAPAASPSPSPSPS